MDDPIVDPGSPGVSHSHEFFGNKTTDASSTEASLTAGATDCRVQLDKSGYWVATLFRNGAPVTPSHINVYYRNPGTSQVPHPFPDGLKVIAGDHMADSAQPNFAKRVFWTCKSGNTGHYASPPNCPGSYLMAQVRFPQCWDGVHVDSADHQSHMAYLTKGACPADHPVLVPQLQFHISWPITDGASANLRLSSGSVYGLHGDFFDAWDTTRLSALISSCIAQGASCHL